VKGQEAAQKVSALCEQQAAGQLGQSRAEQGPGRRARLAQVAPFWSAGRHPWCCSRNPSVGPCGRKGRCKSLCLHP